MTPQGITNTKIFSSAPPFFERIDVLGKKPKDQSECLAFLPRVHSARVSIFNFCQLDLGSCLTEAGAYPQLPTQPNFFYHFQTYTASYYGHSE